MIKGLIFDLDGTLADTIDDIGDAVNILLANHSFPTLTRADHIANICKGARNLVTRSLPPEYCEDAAFIDRCLAEYQGIYANNYLCKTREYAGITASLTTLMKKGYPIGVLSNKPDRYVSTMLSALFPTIRFTFACGKTDLPAKPAPTSALLAAEKMGLSPSEIAFVGDSEVDMQTARNAGMIPVGVSWGYRSERVLKDNGAALICRCAESLATLPQTL